MDCIVEQFNQANHLYQSGKYQQAAKIFRNIIFNIDKRKSKLPVAVVTKITNSCIFNYCMSVERYEKYSVVVEIYQQYIAKHHSKELQQKLLNYQIFYHYHLLVEQQHNYQILDQLLNYLNEGQKQDGILDQLVLTILEKLMHKYGDDRSMPVNVNLTLISLFSQLSKEPYHNILKLFYLQQYQAVTKLMDDLIQSGVMSRYRIEQQVDLYAKMMHSWLYVGCDYNLIKNCLNQIIKLTNLIDLHRYSAYDVMSCWFFANQFNDPLVLEYLKLANQIVDNRKIVYQWEKTKIIHQDNEKSTCLVKLENVNFNLTQLVIFDQHYIYFGPCGLHRKLKMSEYGLGNPTVTITHPVFIGLYTNLNNYYHLLIESFCRIAVFLQLSEFKQVKIAAPNNNTGFEQLVNLFQIPEDRLLRMDTSVTHQFSEVYLLDFESKLPNYIVDKSIWDGYILSKYCLVETNRTIFQLTNSDDQNVDPIVIYIRRKGIRSVVDDEDLFSLMKIRFGSNLVVFENCTDINQQIRLFKRAKLVISPHGAGLSNLLFCQNGTKVIEFALSPNCNQCFGEIARSLDLDYHLMTEINSYYYGTYRVDQDQLVVFNDYLESINLFDETN